MQYQNTLSKPHTVNAVLKVDKPHPNLDCVQNNTLEIIQKQIVKGFKNLSEALHTKQNNGEQTEKGIIKGSLNVTIVENLAIYLNTAAQKLGMKVTKAMPQAR